MRALMGVAALASVAVALVFWLSGGDRVVLAWAMEGQRAAQGGMGQALGALRTGDATAVIPLLAVCFLYGFFHSAGPGHGKLLIGGYGAARAVGAWRLSGVALASSLAQGLTAILLVGLGVWVLDWSRDYMTEVAERLLQPLGFVAVALVGVWLVVRGVRGVRVGPGAGHNHHDHDHGACGHAHAPSAAEVAAVTSTRELAMLIAAVAIRPCTGAIFLLILTAQMGVFVWGIAGTVAMALGTASVTIAVAVAAVFWRQGALAGVSAGAERLARVQPVLEVAVGLTVTWIAGGLALATV